MTPSYIRRVMWERKYDVLAKANYSSKQELAVEREAVSLQPSLLVQADVGMRKPHSLSAMCVSAEKG